MTDKVNAPDEEDWTKAPSNVPTVKMEFKLAMPGYRRLKAGHSMVMPLVAGERPRYLIIELLTPGKIERGDFLIQFYDEPEKSKPFSTQPLAISDVFMTHAEYEEKYPPLPSEEQRNLPELPKNDKQVVSVFKEEIAVAPSRRCAVQITFKSKTNKGLAEVLVYRTSIVPYAGDHPKECSAFSEVVEIVSTAKRMTRIEEHLKI